MKKRAHPQTLQHFHAVGGGLADEIRYWGEWVLKKVKAEIGDLYPLIPDRDCKGEKPRVQAEMWQSSERETVPPGYLVPVAYLFCGGFVLCLGPNRRYLAWHTREEGERRAIQPTSNTARRDGLAHQNGKLS